MGKKKFLDCLKNCNDLYSFIVTLFEYIERKSTYEIQKKYEIIMKTKDKITFDNINRLINGLFSIDLSEQNEFKEWIKIWIIEFNKVEWDDEIFCYISLLRIDDFICEINTTNSHKIIIQRGPLNGNNEYMFYYKPCDSFFGEKIESAKIRRGRQTSEYDSISINKNFKNYEVIKRTHLHDYLPKVNKYIHNLVFNDKIRIGFYSLSINKWFDVEKNNIDKTFSIIYNDMEGYNTQLKNILFEFDKQKADIVIFPELARDPEMEQNIRKFICKSNFQHIKLFFLGSTWNNNTNEALLITGQGTELIREQKQIPYSFFDKCDESLYTESINNKENNKIIHFVDLEGIGRIAYLICADYNDDSINAICSILHTNFVFVSSFSNSTDMMMKTAKSNAERKAISTILCNSCAAVVDYDENDSCVNFVVVPDVKKKSLTSKEQSGIDCSYSQQCEFCKNPIIYGIEKN